MDKIRKAQTDLLRKADVFGENQNRSTRALLRGFACGWASPGRG